MPRYSPPAGAGADPGRWPVERQHSLPPRHASRTLAGPPETMVVSRGRPVERSVHSGRNAGRSGYAVPRANVCRRGRRAVVCGAPLAPTALGTARNEDATTFALFARIQGPFGPLPYGLKHLWQRWYRAHSQFQATGPSNPALTRSSQFSVVFICIWRSWAAGKDCTFGSGIRNVQSLCASVPIETCARSVLTACRRFGRSGTDRGHARGGRRARPGRPGGGSAAPPRHVRASPAVTRLPDPVQQPPVAAPDAPGHYTLTAHHGHAQVLQRMGAPCRPSATAPRTPR